jgi:probable rRNA maturation factor
MGLSIDITVEHDAWSSLVDLEAIVERAAAAALASGDVAVTTDTELSVVFCDDTFIQALNRDWRGKDRPTNVLSFPADPTARAITLGDIVIAYETTAREASSEGRALRDHVTHLVVHGVFHLLGYDHETDSEAEVMEKLEVRALMALGIASPYEDAAPLRACP